MKEKNCLKAWPKMLEADKDIFADTKVSLEDWIAGHASGFLKRKINPSAVPLLSKREMKIIFGDKGSPWHRAMIEAIDSDD